MGFNQRTGLISSNPDYATRNSGTLGKSQSLILPREVSLCSRVVSFNQQIFLYCVSTWCQPLCHTMGCGRE